MKLFGKKNEEQEDEVEEKPVRKRKIVHETLQKDPTRWLSLLFLVIFLFISYLSWVSFTG